MMSRRKGLVAALCMGALVVGAGIYELRAKGTPGRGDIETSAFVAYPGSTVVEDTFRKADHGRYIDTGSFSNPMELVRRYKLSEPVPRADFERWRTATYPLPGWRLAVVVDANETAYERTIGKRHHVLDVSIIAGGLEKPLVPEYMIRYSVS